MLSQPSKEEGVHVRSIARAVGGNAAAIRYIVSQGMISSASLTQSPVML